MGIKKNELRSVFTGDAKSFLRSAKSVGRGAKAAAKAVAVAGAGAAIALGVRGTKAAAEFSLGMAEVATLTKLSSSQQKELSDGVRNLSKEFGSTREELTGGLYQALSAGVPADNAIDFLRTASIAAQAGVADTETAVNGLTSIINVWGKENVTAMEAADSMFTTVRLGKTNFTELSDSIGQVAPVAKAVGMSFDEMNAFLAEMTARGLKTTEATTALKGILSSMLAPTGKLSGALGDVKKNGLAATLTALSDKADGSVEAIAAMFPNIRGLLGVLSGGIGTGGTMGATLEEFTNKAGAAKEASAKIAAAFGTDFKKIRAEFDDALLDLGIELQPVVRRITNDVINMFSDPDFKTGVKDLADVLSMILSIGGGATKLWGGAGNIARGAVDKGDDMMGAVAGWLELDPERAGKEISSKSIYLPPALVRQDLNQVRAGMEGVTGKDLNELRVKELGFLEQIRDLLDQKMPNAPGT